jgi:hypothetical protein
LIRFAWFLMIWTPFPAVIGYVIAWFIVPDKEEIHANNISTRTTTTSSAGSKEFLAG